MLISMTGHGSASDTFDWGMARLDIYSVNSRYQNIAVRCPKELYALEYPIREELKDRFKRGKLTVSLYASFAPDLKTARINGDVLENYFEELMSIHGRLKLLEEIQLEILLDLPGVLEQPEVCVFDIYDKVVEDTLSVLNEALSKWNEMRRIEGDHIASFIIQTIDKYEILIANIEKEWDNAFHDELEELKRKISLLLPGKIQEDETSHFDGVALLADKWDIKEEITRSKSHIIKFRETLNSPSSEGKKLDFLLQEMLREINTIASKVKNAQIRWYVVEGKCLLEQIREHVQNVE
ncbi:MULTISPECIES: YicC/YloC family endoribonuclease [Acetomicrobium]|uniref:YicC/YloC family endoribonuclease n=1 Tax=Acetomicrobium TaxID=49894 RepID=UPI0026F188AF|nr:MULTISPECIES: YicC/YloC family endoribonuclease [Acetomicrobium]MDR9770628.1 YicC/YloC family endoribonuclease [Acetomicrobium sp.]HOB10164.1 YicC family protein [Acetomicrobium sp.]HPT64661.1 YicC family protein [Acetomicrobium sp.]HQA36455.1 YicC family protein [Acetomicrobium sp.]HQC87731.1 YicC family protein [Acetomicrobium sp.]